MDWSFGLTMMLMGMGGTLLTLLFLSLLIGLLVRLFPDRSEQAKGTGGPGMGAH